MRSLFRRSVPAPAPAPPPQPGAPVPEYRPLAWFRPGVQRTLRNRYRLPRRVSPAALLFVPWIDVLLVVGAACLFHSATCGVPAETFRLDGAEAPSVSLPDAPFASAVASPPQPRPVFLARPAQRNAYPRAKASPTSYLPSPICDQRQPRSPGGCKAAQVTDFRVDARMARSARGELRGRFRTARRRRIPRRRFHALRIDTLLVLAATGLLVFAFPRPSAFRPPAPKPPPYGPAAAGAETGRAPSGPASIRFSILPSRLSSPASARFFSPTLIPFGTDGYLPGLAALPEPDAAIDARRPLAPPETAPAPPVHLRLPIPVETLEARLSQAPGLFPVAVQPVRFPRHPRRRAPRGEALLFPSSDGTAPTVFLDTAGDPALDTASLLSRAFELRLPPSSTNETAVRVPLADLPPR